MTKNILIICVLAMASGIMAFGFVQWNNKPACKSGSFHEEFSKLLNNSRAPELFYKVGNRWSTKTKDDLHTVKTLSDLISTEATQEKTSFKNVTLSILHNDQDVRDIITSEMGQHEILNDAQLRLLQSCDYSTNLRVTALSLPKNAVINQTAYDSLVRYITIIPEYEAQFEGGNDALISYVKDALKEEAKSIQKYKLQACQVFFTVTESGTIDHVKLVATSGYDDVDSKLVNILTEMPAKWMPAKNTEGENVSQELVFFFGAEGC